MKKEKNNLDWIGYCDKDLGIIYAVNYDCNKIKKDLRKKYGTYEKVEKLITKLIDNNITEEFLNSSSYWKNCTGKTIYLFQEDFIDDGYAWWKNSNISSTPTKLKVKEK